MTTRPAKPEQFKRRQERMRNLGVLSAIPVAIVHECKCVLTAYYGNRFRLALHLVWEGVYLTAHDRYWRIVLWVSDTIGWTKLQPFSPDRPDIRLRHGRQCDKLNCSDNDCLYRSLPRWYSAITGFGKD